MTDYIEKYYLKDKGLTLEKNSPKNAIKYYNELLTHPYFNDDYYLYRRLAMMYGKTREYEKQTGIIRDFFKSRTYANEYNLLWFEYKLNSLSDMGFITHDEIEKLVKYHKNTTFKTDPHPPIADRIKKLKGEIYIESEDKYDKRQTRYAYEARASELYRQKKYPEYIDFLNHMIDDVGYRRYEYFKKLCVAYRRLDDRENEMKTIERYYNGESTRGKLSDAWFEKRLKDLNDVRNEIAFSPSHPDENPLYEYDDSLPELENLKRKNAMIEYAKILNENDAILYYKYLSTNTYFSNDCYPYMQLSIIYDKLEDYNAELVNIKKLLYSKIYLDDYHFLWFSDRLRVLLDLGDVREETVQKWLDYYEMHGALNRHKINKFQAAKFITENNEIHVLSDDEFEKNQKRLLLEKTGLIYESVGNFELAITHYTNLIYDKDFSYCIFYKRLCECLCEINDYGRCLKAIRLYYTHPPKDVSLKSDEYFKKQLMIVNDELNADFKPSDFTGH